ncbi:hypothetical protein AGMMS49992_27140 [Clostridia bacterium]|nr:hypothetical protein AGMMS49992_27140 [Clostridia bacterium]
MKVIMVEPNKKAYVTEIEDSLAAEQKAVGGYIQAVYPFMELVAIVCNEEAKLDGLPPNRALYDDENNLYDIICGNFFICGLSEDNFADIQEENIEKFLNMYLYPETFIRLGDKIIAIKDTTNRDERG